MPCRGRLHLLLPLLCALAMAHPAWAAELSFTLAPASPQEGQAFTLKGTFSPPGQVARARVRLRTTGEKEFVPLDLNRIPGPQDVWEARVEGSEVEAAGLEFFVVAQTKAGKVVPVLGSPTAPSVLQVVPRDPNALPPLVDVNPLETAEERELRTGERAGGGTMVGGKTLLKRSRKQASDLRPVEEGSSSQAAQAMQEEMAVFAAEDATAIAATYAQKTRTAPAIITVFRRAQIEQMRARTLLDILKLIPGFETSKSILGFDEVSVRGIRSDPEMLLLVDGHRVANVYDGRIPWAIPAEVIERVEVIRGPGSAIYGTGAFLGVVNVVTRETEYVSTRVATTFLKPSPQLMNGKTSALPVIKDANPYNPDNDIGAAGLFAPEASMAGGINKGGVKAYASGYAKASRGQRMPVAADSFTDSGINRAPESMQTESREARVTLTGKVDWTPSFTKGGHVFARTFFNHEDRGPTFGVFDTLGPRSQLAWLMGTADVGYAQPFGDGGEVLVRLYGDGHFVDRRLQLTPDGFNTADRNGDGARELWPQGVLARNIYATAAAGTEARVLLPQIFRHRLNIGMQAEANVMPYYRFTLNRDASGSALKDLAAPSADTIPQDQNQAWRMLGAVFVQDEWRVTDRIFATVGLRANYIQDRINPPASGTSTQQAVRDNIKWDPRTHITPRAALVFEPVDNLAIKFLYGSAFRTPTFEEQYDQTSLAYSDFSPGVFLGNKKLEPEYIQTAESGLDYGFTLGGFKYRAAGNMFYSFIGNSIDRIDESGSQEPVQNRGFRHVAGMEAEGRVEFTQGTYIYGNASWHRGWFVEPDPAAAPRLDWLKPDTYVTAVTGFPNSPEKTQVSYLTVVPQYRANLGANVELLELLNFHVDLMLGSERRNNVRSTLERIRAFKIPAYALLNAGVRTRPIFGWFGFEANVYNALDYDYRDDVPRPDRVKELLPREGMTIMLGTYLSH